jgi:hypothetical protein
MNERCALGYICTMEVRRPKLHFVAHRVFVTFRIVVSYDWSSSPFEIVDYHPCGSTRIDQTTNSFRENKQFIGQYPDPDTNLS